MFATNSWLSGRLGDWERNKFLLATRYPLPTIFYLPNLLGIPSHPPGTVERDFSPHQEHI